MRSAQCLSGKLLSSLCSDEARAGQNDTRTRRDTLLPALKGQHKASASIFEAICQARGMSAGQ